MKRRNFSPEFKRESAQLVVDQNYTVSDAAKAMDVGLSTITKWVKQLRDERQGKTPKASPITPEQIEIRELKKKLQRIEMENDILKKATVDSICQCNTPFNYLFRCFELQCLSRSVARRYLELHDEIADLDVMIAAIVDELAPELIKR
ncbi:transposase, partial [Escherichia coli]